MTRRKFMIAGMIAPLIAVIQAAAAAPAYAAGSRRSSSRSSRVQAYRTEQRLRVNRTHHRGRSFQDRRSQFRGQPALRREEKARKLAIPDRPDK